MKNFNELGLSANILRAIEYSEPTPIQAQAIPVILKGQDVMACAQTGTGKTASFTLPLLHRLSETTPETHQGRRVLRALILTPTRELAAQVSNSIGTYGKYLPLRSFVIFGGVNIEPQIQKMRKGVDILVATPGRLLDHVNRRTVDLSKVDVLVLDEADRMLDMGFINDIRRIIGLLPKKRLNLLFSATFSTEVKSLASTFLHNPKLIEVASQNKTPDLIDQSVYPVNHENKRALISYLIGFENWHQVLIFTKTKYGANRLAQQLETDGISATAIHGNKTQGARTRALAEFKRGSVQVLVATDIAARGLDIDQLSHVVNFDLPRSPEDYVHRIGRTGRAGKDGKAISLVSSDEMGALKNIERLLKKTLPRIVVPGYEPTHAAPKKEEPQQKRFHRHEQPRRSSAPRKQTDSKFKRRNNPRSSHK